MSPSPISTPISTRRIIATAVVALLTLTATGCGSDSAESAASASDSTTPVTDQTTDTAAVVPSP